MSRNAVEAGDKRIFRKRAVAVGSGSLGAFALGALAVGALAIGALAIGRLAVGRFTAKEARIGRLTIDHLEIKAVNKLPKKLARKLRQ